MHPCAYMSVVWSYDIMRRDAPSDEFVENLHVVLYVVELRRLFRLEDGEWRCSAILIEVVSTWLQQTADDEDIEESIGIFQKFEGRSCLDELVCNGVEVSLRYGLEVLVYLVSEDYKGVSETDRERW